MATNQLEVLKAELARETGSVLDVLDELKETLVGSNWGDVDGDAPLVLLASLHQQLGTIKSNVAASAFMLKLQNAALADGAPA